MTSVKYVHSDMVGAPTLDNNWGSMTNLLDAVLVNGFNLKTVASLTRDGDTVTASFAASHGYQIDQIVEIAGCDQAAYNGQHRVTWIDTNNVRFTVPGTPATPATGAAISCKMAPLGFAIAFTGTHKRVYRSPNIQGTRPFLRINDGLPPNGYTTTWAKFARVSIATEMVDVDTYAPGAAIAPFDPAAPNRNELGSGVTGQTGYHGWYKWMWSYASNTEVSGGAGGNRPWDIIGDDRGFYINLNQGWNGGHYVYAAGEFNSFKPADQYNQLLIAHADYVAANGSNRSYPHQYNWSHQSLEGTGKVIPRNWTGVGNNVNFGMLGLNVGNDTQYSGWSSHIPFPNGPDMSLVLHPAYMRETTGHLRGIAPGMHWAHASQPYTHRTVIENVIGNAGRKFVYLRVEHSSSGNIGGHAFDITGPWLR